MDNRQGKVKRFFCTSMYSYGITFIILLIIAIGEAAGIKEFLYSIYIIFFILVTPFWYAFYHIGFSLIIILFWGMFLGFYYFLIRKNVSYEAVVILLSLMLFIWEMLGVFCLSQMIIA